MPFPKQIEELIVEYSDWLIKFADQTPYIYSSQPIQKTTNDFKQLRPEDKTIERRLKVISLFVYSQISSSLIRTPVFILNGKRFTQICQIETFENVQEYNANNSNSRLITIGPEDNNNQQHQIVIPDYLKMEQLELANDVFFKKWIIRCNQGENWQNVRRAINEISDKDLKDELGSWIENIEETQEDILNNITITLKTNKKGMAMLCGASGAFVGLVICTIIFKKIDEPDMLLLAFLVALISGVLSGAAGYYYENYDDVIEEKICIPIKEKICTPCWAVMRQLGHLGAVNRPLLENDIELQVFNQPVEDPVREPELVFPQLTL